MRKSKCKFVFPQASAVKNKQLFETTGIAKNMYKVGPTIYRVIYMELYLVLYPV